MTKFKIQVETKQLWEVVTEANSKEEAEKIRDDFYEEMQEQCEGLVLQFQQTREPAFELKEFWGGDDFSEDNITDLEIEELPEAERASLTAVYTLFTTCPECGTETEYNDEQPEYAEIMDAMQGNGFAVVTCPDCETKYKQLSYKEY